LWLLNGAILPLGRLKCLSVYRLKRFRSKNDDLFTWEFVMTIVRFVFVLVSIFLFSTTVFAVTAKPAVATPDASARRGLPPRALAPLVATIAPASSHAPFESGDCELCHAKNDPKQPGEVANKGTSLCLGCHEEFNEVLKRPNTHHPARTACIKCHNPHNAMFPKLLLQETRVMCTGCHKDIGETMSNSTVPHKALSAGAQCTNCHNPHGSQVEMLLHQLPFDLCVNCHKVDTMADAKGKKLQNMKAWLDNNPNWHGPVAKKDCVACHQPHGGNNFRLLEKEYPKEFYATYSAENYALCFSCHNEKAFSSESTSTLTGFRNGVKNLHFVHLQQAGRGRTCRACHEVHASEQKHHIRDGVPYGSGGWVLKLNYEQTATGGSCAKTCHQQKTYSNRSAP
jgi:predicted CXXCH cytochrome family protein